MVRNNREIGSSYEEAAASYIEKNGGRILERNFRCRHGEIDLIAKDGKYICFVEVKARNRDRSGYAEEAVTLKKQRIISRVADFYRVQAKLKEDAFFRFDVIAINGDELIWHKNAFMYI